MQLALARPLDWRSWWVFSVIAALAVALILWLGRDLSFFHDDCSFIALGWSDLLYLHNGHPVIIPLAAWLSVETMFGLDSYLPFRALVLIPHVAFAAGVYALFARRSHLVALAAGTLALLFGWAWENIYWGFQVGFVTSAAAGLWALLALERRRYALGLGLLAVSLLSSGMGAPFVAAAAALVWRGPVVAAVVGIVVEYGLIAAFGRPLEAPRYLTTAAAFSFLAVAHLPWPPRSVMVGAYVVLLTVNATWLVGGPVLFSSLAASGFACGPITES